MVVNITKKIVLTFVIGLLVGAIITTACFLIFSKCAHKDGNMPNQPSFSQQGNLGMPGKDSRSNSDSNQNQQQLPGQNGQTGDQNANQNGNQNGSQMQPPELPGNSNSNSGSNAESLPQVPNSNN